MWNASRGENLQHLMQPHKKFNSVATAKLNTRQEKLIFLTDIVSWSIIQTTSPIILLIQFCVFPPGSSTPVTNEVLQAVTNDISNATNRVITFSVIRHPKLGRLVMTRPDNSTVDISTFTQEMVSEELEVKSVLSHFTLFWNEIKGMWTRSGLNIRVPPFMWKVARFPQYE